MIPPSCLCGSSGSSSILADYDPTKGGEEQVLLDEATDLPVCNYDENPTPLYKAMETHQWGAVARFLKTGVWPGNFFGDAQTPKTQAKTWVHRYDDTKHELRDDDDMLKMEGTTVFHKSAAERARLNALRRKNQRVLRWKQLPLHAALIFMAPPSITKQIIELFPYALRCADDKGMLPLHLAFRQAVPDDILTILLKLFPNAMHVKDKKGRLPVECVRMDLLSTNDALVSNTAGPSALRGMIVQSIMQQSKEKFSQEQQHTVERFQNDITGLHTKLQQLESHLQRMGEREEQTRQELHTTLDELNVLKKNHKKLQEIQKYAMEKQTVQEQQNEFQRRIMEQLSTVHQGQDRGGGGRRYYDDEEDSRDDYQHIRRRRGRSRHRHSMEPPPSRTPSMPPSLPQQDQDSQYSNTEDRSMALTHHTQRVPSQSSYYSQTDNNANGTRKHHQSPPSLDQFLNKYHHDPDDAYMTEDNNSYSPSSYSEYTKSILQPNPTGYTTGKSSVAPSMIMQRDDTMTWNSTRRSVPDGKTPRSSNALMSGDQPLHAHQSVLPLPPSSRRSMGANNASMPVRRPTPVDTAVASQSLMALNPNGNNGSEEHQKQATKACSPQSLNWDLSGFLRPLGNSS